MHDADDEPTPAPGDLVKVWFRFVPREGWLPYDREGLWAILVTDDTARVNNIPFLQDGVAEDDVVRFVTGDDGLYYAAECVESSGNCTVRVLPHPDGPLGRSSQAVRDRFAPFGIEGEAFSPEFPMVAFTVPPDADYAAIIALLRAGQADGWWHYEFGCTTEAWRSEYARSEP